MIALTLPLGAGIPDAKRITVVPTFVKGCQCEWALATNQRFTKNDVTALKRQAPNDTAGAVLPSHRRCVRTCSTNSAAYSVRSPGCQRVSRECSARINRTRTLDQTIIVAGTLTTDLTVRIAHLTRSAAIVEQARATAGCLGFSLVADFLAAERINVFSHPLP